MNFGFFTLVNDYILTVRKNYILDILFPLLLSVVCFFLLMNELLIIEKDFISNILSTLGIIAGFSLTAITMLVSSDSKSIKTLKKKMSGIIIDGLEISVFRKFYILISYSVLITFIAIIINVIGYLIPFKKIFTLQLVTVLKSLNLFLLFHIFFLNIRNISSLYFIYFKETNLKSEEK